MQLKCTSQVFLLSINTWESERLKCCLFCGLLHRGRVWNTNKEWKKRRNHWFWIPAAVNSRVKMSLCPSTCPSLFTQDKERLTGLSTPDCKFEPINELDFFFFFYILTVPVEWNPELHFPLPALGCAINGTACWRRTWGLVFVKHKGDPPVCKINQMKAKCWRSVSFTAGGFPGTLEPLAARAEPGLPSAGDTEPPPAASKTEQGNTGLQKS